MRIFNIVNIDFGADRLKEFCINNLNSISASIKSIISQVNVNSNKINGLLNSSYSGVYSPSVTLTANLSAATASEAMFNVSNGLVFCSGNIQTTAINPSGILTSLRITLPVQSNITSIYDVNGVCNGVSYDGEFGIIGDITNNEAIFSGIVFSSSSEDNRFFFMYRIK